MTNALNALRSAGARVLPSNRQVQSASNGTAWSGTKVNGDVWMITKNDNDSYDVRC